MSKSTLVALLALIASIGTYAINDLKSFTRYEQRVDTLVIDVQSLKEGSSRVPVLENRVDNVEQNTNRLIDKMDKVLDALIGGKG